MTDPNNVTRQEEIMSRCTHQFGRAARLVGLRTGAGVAIALASMLSVASAGFADYSAHQPASQHERTLAALKHQFPGAVYSPTGQMQRDGRYILPSKDSFVVVTYSSRWTVESTVQCPNKSVCSR